MPARDILTSLQQNFLQQLGRSKLSEFFFLTGGTALSAFFLEHRYSKVWQEAYGIFTDNALDIACNKLSALFDRAEAKDFVDVFFIDRELFRFAELLKKAKEKHVGLDDYWLAIAMLKIEELGLLPRMVKPVSLDELKFFFLAHARQLMA